MAATKNAAAELSKIKLDLELFMTVALATPQEDPNDPGCIWGVPVNLVGLSGIGKTERVVAIGRAMGLKVWPVYVTTKQPEDFTGAIVPTPNGIVIECILPAARRCIDEGGGVIFLDEISDARPAVQAACHSFVNERRVGDHVLPPRTRIVLAMNPPDRATAGYGLSGPMANRMAHVDYPPPTWQEWVAWLSHQNKFKLDKAEDVEMKVKKTFASVWPSVVGMEAGYMKSRDGEGLHKQPLPDSPDVGGAWPSPRTWNWTIRAITTCRCLGAPKSLEFQFAKSLLGEGIGIEFMTWVLNNDLPDPEKMLREGWSPSGDRIDRDFACINAIVSFVMGQTTKKARIGWATPAWQALKRVMQSGHADLLIEASENLVKAGLAHETDDAALTAIASDVIFEMTKDGYYKYAGAKT